MNELPPRPPANNFVWAGPQEYVQQDRGLHLFTPVALLAPIWHELLGVARNFSAQGQYAIAIVIAAAAGEWTTTSVMSRLLESADANGKAAIRLKKKMARTDWPITWSLENRGIRNAYIELTNEDPTQHVWWTDWTKSRDERHDIVHRGKITATADVAKQCIDAAQAYIGHLVEVVERLPVARAP